MKSTWIIIVLFSGLLAVSILAATNGVVLAQPEVELNSSYVEGPLPITDPQSPIWDRIQPIEVPLSGQTVTAPMKPEPFAKAISVKAVNNGTHIAFLLQWPDPTRNDRTVKIDEFRDAAAVQFAPPGELPFICMGSTTIPLTILQWKADWQADIEEGFQDLQSAFPNFWVDVYPNAIGEPPYAVPEA
ncbi:MAG: ethylbenzene dehydrogenase-related protein, partial [Candidatus Bathyarchaeia archaeon]